MQSLAFVKRDTTDIQVNSVLKMFQNNQINSINHIWVLSQCLMNFLNSISIVDVCRCLLLGSFSIDLQPSWNRYKKKIILEYFFVNLKILVKVFFSLTQNFMLFHSGFLIDSNTVGHDHLIYRILSVTTKWRVSFQIKDR